MDARLSQDGIIYRTTRELPLEGVTALYRANHWSAGQKPHLLLQALRGSHSLVSAWSGETLVGLGNAISDGYLVVYYPHLLVLPDYQRRGIGSEIMRRLLAEYPGFHQHILVADAQALEFYRKLGFTRAGRTEPMWIYAGGDH